MREGERKGENSGVVLCGDIENILATKSTTRGGRGGKRRGRGEKEKMTSLQPKQRVWNDLHKHVNNRGRGNEQTASYKVLLTN
jgi:hypothetical protein